MEEFLNNKFNLFVVYQENIFINLYFTMIILNSLGKPTLKYPLLGCLSVCFVSELRAGRSVVVTEFSSQFLAAYEFSVLFFKLKPRKMILIVAIGADKQVVVFDD